MLRTTAWLFLFLFGCTALEARVALTKDRLVVDGKPAPFLFGAEIQYFRARGGVDDTKDLSEAGRNVPAARVEALWRKLLQRAKEAHMNTITFYVPWDFHEPTEGVFDFDGTLDRDGDGRPDYPSRNLKKFLQLIDEYGFRYVMVRPGPYINAEWGPVGFGAVPRWFLENPKYAPAIALGPATHFATTPEDKAKEAAKMRAVATFSHPLYRERVDAWFKALRDVVLKDALGTNKATVFLQLDNETNYFWTSAYERDWNPVVLDRYRAWIQTKYGRNTLSLQQAYGGGTFAALLPPRSPDDRTLSGLEWHRDWYRFHDAEILAYHQWLRDSWEKLDVKEPSVLFTVCDSFNALGWGVLPRLDRQDNRLALTTMNVYPKTSGTVAESTLNEPMKAAHDAALVAASHAQYYGTGDRWVMATEAMGGWFGPTEVNVAARQHTWGSLLGADVKALIVYYFHEGWNWTGLDGPEVSEAKLLDALKAYDIGILRGPALLFDAPLDRFANPNRSKTQKEGEEGAFAVLQRLGASLDAGLGAKLIDSRVVTAPIALLHDSLDQAPSPKDAHVLDAASKDSAATYGWLREAGYTPDMVFLDRATPAALAKYRVVVLRHRSELRVDALIKLTRFVQGGGKIVVLGGPVPKGLPDNAAVALEPDPSRGWNSDAYEKLPHATAALSHARRLFRTLGVRSVATLTPDDGAERIHVTVRRTHGRNLVLFVENFRRGGARKALLQLQKELVGDGTYALVPLWRKDAQTKDEGVQFESAQLLRGTARIPVSDDGVDVWELVPR